MYLLAYSTAQKSIIKKAREREGNKTEAYTQTKDK